MRVRPFHADLGFGLGAEADPTLRRALSLLYPGAQIQPANPKEDRRGVDLWVVKKSGDRVGVQVKARRVSFLGDVFLEIHADLDRGVPGWALDAGAEILAVVYKDRILLFHMPTLAYLARENWREWEVAGYGHITKSEKRPGQVYESFGVFVPLQELGPALLLSVPRLRTGDAA